MNFFFECCRHINDLSNRHTCLNLLKEKNRSYLLLSNRFNDTAINSNIQNLCTVTIAKFTTSKRSNFMLHTNMKQLRAITISRIFDRDIWFDKSNINLIGNVVSQTEIFPRIYASRDRILRISTFAVINVRYAPPSARFAITYLVVFLCHQGTDIFRQMEKANKDVFDLQTAFFLTGFLPFRSSFLSKHRKKKKITIRIVCSQKRALTI